MYSHNNLPHPELEAVTSAQPAYSHTDFINLYKMKDIEDNLVDLSQITALPVFTFCLFRLVERKYLKSDTLFHFFRESTEMPNDIIYLISDYNGFNGYHYRDLKKQYDALKKGIQESSHISLHILNKHSGLLKLSGLNTSLEMLLVAKKIVAYFNTIYPNSASIEKEKLAAENIINIRIDYIAICDNAVVSGFKKILSEPDRQLQVLLDNYRIKTDKFNQEDALAIHMLRDAIYRLSDCKLLTEINTTQKIILVLQRLLNTIQPKYSSLFYPPPFPKLLAMFKHCDYSLKGTLKIVTLLGPDLLSTTPNHSKAPSTRDIYRQVSLNIYKAFSLAMESFEKSGILDEKSIKEWRENDMFRLSELQPRP